MKLWRVRVEVRGYAYVIVPADDEDEAMEKARSADWDSLDVSDVEPLEVVRND